MSVSYGCCNCVGPQGSDPLCPCQMAAQSISSYTMHNPISGYMVPNPYNIAPPATLAQPDVRDYMYIGPLPFKQDDEPVWHQVRARSIDFVKWIHQQDSVSWDMLDVEFYTISDSLWVMTLLKFGN